MTHDNSNHVRKCPICAGRDHQPIRVKELDAGAPVEFAIAFLCPRLHAVRWLVGDEWLTDAEAKRYAEIGRGDGWRVLVTSSYVHLTLETGVLDLRDALALGRHLVDVAKSPPRQP